MSTPVKFLLFLIGSFFVLAVALTVFIKTQVTPEKVRETLLPIAESTLDRDVDFGAIKIGLFSGISLADLKVMLKDGTGEFFSVDSVELHYRFWPLLKGQVVVDQILLDQPKINVTRLPDGQFNFSDLLKDPGVSSEKQTVGSQAVEEAGSAFNLLVKEVNLQGGELLYIDRYKNVKAPFRYTLKNLNFKARQITLDRSFPVDLSAVINGSNIDISGNYDFSKRTGDLTVHLAALDLVKFAPYYRDSLPGKLGSAQLGLKLDVDLQPDRISSKGKIDLDHVDLVLDDYRDFAIADAVIGTEYSLDYIFDKQQLTLSTLLFRFNNVNFGAEGQFILSSDKPFLVFSLLFDQLDLREVMQNLPETLSKDYQKYSFAGLIDGRVDFAGRADSGINLLKSAKLKLTDVRASAENLRAGISGDILYSDKALKSDNLQLEYGGQRVTLRVNAEKQADGLLHGNFDLLADTLNINDLLISETENQQTESVPRSGDIPVARKKTLADEIGPYDIPAAMTGTLAVKHLLYKQLDVSNVTADLQIRNNRLTVTDLNGAIGRGDMSGNALVDLGVKGLAYSGHLVLVQPNITTIMTGLFPQSDQSVSGQLHWRGDFSGQGTLHDNILRTLRLNGDFDLRDGIAKGSPLLGQFATFLDNKDLKVLSFRLLSGEYKLYNGLARFDARLDSSKTKLATSGTLTLDSMLDMKLDARFAPEVVKKLGIDKKIRDGLSDRDGWGRLPLLVDGSLEHPHFSYDTEVLQQQLVEKASQKLLEKIAPDGGKDAEPLREMLDNTLNKLFGK